MDSKQLNEITKTAYDVSREVWLLAKNYLQPDKLKTNQTDEYWEELIDDYNKILDRLENQPEYVNKMAEQMIVGVTRLLEGVMREK